MIFFINYYNLNYFHFFYLIFINYYKLNYIHFFYPILVIYSQFYLLIHALKIYYSSFINLFLFIRFILNIFIRPFHLNLFTHLV